MLLLLLGSLLVSLTHGNLVCDWTGYPDPTSTKKVDSLGWLNLFIDDWLQTNTARLTDRVGEMVSEAVEGYLPTWMVGLKLEKFGVEPGYAPIISRIASLHDVVKCCDSAINSTCNSSVTLRRIIYDVHVAFVSKTSVAELTVELPLGVSGGVAISDVALMSTGRVEVLMDTRAPMPGLVSATFTFTEKPKFTFNVDLFNWIGKDTFGVSAWVKDTLDNLIMSKLVHPGTLFVDLRDLGSANGAISYNLIPSNKAEFPAAFSVGLKAFPLSGDESQEFSLAIKWNKKDLIGSQHFVSKCNWWFDFALPDMSDPLVQVEIREVRTLAKDPVIYTQWLDISNQIYVQDGGVSNFLYNYSIGLDNEWSFNITFQALLLPAALIEQKNTQVTSYPSLFTTASCSSSGCPSEGILYIHLHRVANLRHKDTTTMDPYVKFSLVNTSQNAKSSTKLNAKDAVFDEVFQLFILKLSKAVPLSHQSLVVEVWDKNTFTSNLLVGKHVIHGINNTPEVNKKLLLSGDGSGAVYLSIAFKPVPFY